MLYVTLDGSFSGYCMVRLKRYKIIGIGYIPTLTINEIVLFFRTKTIIKNNHPFFNSIP